jgi:hypothetical protein
MRSCKILDIKQLQKKNSSEVFRISLLAARKKNRTLKISGSHIQMLDPIKPPYWSYLMLRFDEEHQIF